jgi:large subunit ribosomal protein L4
MATILSQLVREDRLSVVEQLSLESPKTKLLAGKIKGMGFEKVLVITDDLDDNLYLSSRNLPNLLVLEVAQADPVSLIRFPNVILTKGAVRKLEEVYA